jgi:tetratricopeptide (TPR) repeat protein
MKVMCIFLLATLMGCSFAKKEKADPYYLTGPKEQQERLNGLFSLLDGDVDREELFSLVREIASSYARQKEYGRLINFLCSHVESRPDDPNNAYYLLMIAYAYTEQEAYPVAELYFDVIVKNYPDLLIQGRSIHLVCLNQLLVMTQDPERRIKYYQKLISNFPDKTDLGADYFMLGQAYEQTGEWELAIQAYAQFLSSSLGADIPGFPDAENYAKRLIDFNNSPKDWTFETLNGLVNAVSTAINAGDGWRLWSYRAKVNFFARSWAHEVSDDSGMSEFSLPVFMQGANIQYAPSLDSSSNATEAYLKTWGWTQSISTWYFYFRKIYFPVDPDVHGRWEWAGVYYGEKF